MPEIYDSVRATIRQRVLGILLNRRGWYTTHELLSEIDEAETSSVMACILSDLVKTKRLVNGPKRMGANGKEANTWGINERVRAKAEACYHQALGADPVTDELIATLKATAGREEEEAQPPAAPVKTKAKPAVTLKVGPANLTRVIEAIEAEAFAQAHQDTDSSLETMASLETQASVETTDTLEATATPAISADPGLDPALEYVLDALPPTAPTAPSADEASPASAPPTAGPALPDWVQGLRAWLPDLPADLGLYGLNLDCYAIDTSQAEVRLRVMDHGGGAFAGFKVKRDDLCLDPGDLAALDQLSQALCWVYDGIQDKLTTARDAKRLGANQATAPALGTRCQGQAGGHCQCATARPTPGPAHVTAPVTAPSPARHTRDYATHP